MLEKLATYEVENIIVLFTLADKGTLSKSMCQRTTGLYCRNHVQKTHKSLTPDNTQQSSFSECPKYARQFRNHASHKLM
jgi:hypothetical protein